MDIKKIVKSQTIRHKVLKSLGWVPNWLMVRLQYRVILHRWPNLNSPRRFTEWLQIYKIKYRNPLLPICVDKYEVRKYIETKIQGRDILNKLYQVCDRGEEIDFAKLPNKFVIKSTNGGNGDNVLIVKDKDLIDYNKVVKDVNKWLSKNYNTISREWAYCNSSKHPRIIVEKYLENSDENSDLDDYKFLCFNGVVQVLWVDKDRYNNHKRGFWNNKFEFIEDVKSDHPTFLVPPKLPENIEEMRSIAQTLSKDFPFVRVDLYNVKGRIIFGELTFYPWSGYVQFDRDSFDYELGEYFKKAWKVSGDYSK